MLNKIKTLFSVCIFLLGTTVFLLAAGSYMENADGTYDVKMIMQDNPNLDNKLTIGKQVFSGSVDINRNSYLIGENNYIYTPIIYNPMSTESDPSRIMYNANTSLYTSDSGDEQRYEMKKPYVKTSERLLPGFSAMAKSMVKQKTLGIFDVYPGTANIINNSDIKISFKVNAAKDSNGTYTKPYMDLTGLTVKITEEYEGNASSITSNVAYFVFDKNKDELVPTGNNSMNNRWAAHTFHGLSDGQAVGFNLIYESQTMDAGAMISLQIEVPFVGAESKQTFYAQYITEGVPFLERVVSNNSESGWKDGPTAVPLNGGLYGWTAAGGSDINGDGFPDLVVGDPYYKYSNMTSDAMRGGRVYVYFGGPDKVLDVTKDLPSPDITIENDFAIGNAARSRDREFGFKVKLADINN
ncbi:MAG: integrin alpha, partial [Candidatus Margulisbacteria bacterium]|nr:integrin alpha [Candidatus Margulisiibacteriota bacterium]